MASIYPDSKKTRVIFASRAEEIFYEQCRRSLGAAWKVFYSCTLSSIESGQGLKDNEIDFVIYHPRYGIFVVEVKGGRIRYDKDKKDFHSINRMGQEFSIKNPFAQVLSWKSRFLRKLKEREIKVPVSQVVCFPNVELNEFPKVSEIEPETIIDRHRLGELEQTLKKIATTLQPERFLRFEDCSSKLEKLLIGQDFCTKIYVRDYIDSHEHRVIDVEGFQASLVTPVASVKRLAMEGEAGTGKTILASHLAQYFRDKQKKVLLLTSSEMLIDYLRSIIGENVVIEQYLGLARTSGIDLLSPPADFKGKRNDWTQVEAPTRLAKIFETSKNFYDVIICDEAQDVQPFWWQAIEKLLKPNSKDSRLYILFDRSQGIFGSGSGEKSFVPEEVLPIQPPYFPLVHNYRTTREIATFARAFRTGTQILESHSPRLGYIPQIITYKDNEEAKYKLEALLKRLVETESLSPDEITLLSARRPQQEPSVLAKVKELNGIPLQQMHRNKTSDKSMFLVSTISAFKGLETKIGILLNFSEYNMPLSNPIMSSLLYVAATRAKHLLYIFVKSTDVQKLKSIENALRTIKEVGGLVIDPTDPDHELIGEVVHYNPDRVGWLEVNDPLFPKGNVMFFPSDVERAKLGEVKPGVRLRFRPKTEGQATIASDLKISS